ncbi:hypothetical protein [Agrobacterium tumefaciens]|uniref:Uncharacterized protein n=1 Tax=Agrobacterium tumefaciens TaxID=358 RepID=A0A4D7YWS1_AGRTU|nr:hypothetical protein [Agrobacterium tumefaciens]QCL95489.1 hypothetical protein CFBP7129_14365 [Agrobacterium tumefaciens]
MIDDYLIPIEQYGQLNSPRQIEISPTRPTPTVKLRSIAALLLTTISIFFNETKYAAASQIDTRHVILGNNEYDLSGTLNIKKIDKSYSHKIKGKEYLIYHAMTIDSSHNLCGSDDLYVSLEWTGAALTTQPFHFKDFELTKIEKNVYYTINSYLSSPEEASEVFRSISRVHSGQVGSRTYQSVDFAVALRKVGIAPPARETRYLITSDNRIISIINIGKKNNPTVLTIDYQNSNRDYIVHTNIKSRKDINSSIECAVKTISNVSEAVFRSQIATHGVK